MSALRAGLNLGYDATLFPSRDEHQVLFLADFLPLILFLGAYLYKDIYFAVVVLMIAMPIGLAVKYLISGKMDRIYLWSTIFLFVMGGATVYLRNPIFLFWKPTAFYWALALAFLLSRWLGNTVLVEKFFAVVGKLPTDRISQSQWQVLNLVWVTFFIALGLLNIYVAYNYSEAFWVRFKVFGLMGITLIFMTAQTFWIVSRFEKRESDTDDLEV